MYWSEMSGGKKIDHRIFSSLTSTTKTLSTSEPISFDKYIHGKYGTERIVTKDEYKPS